MLSSAYLRLLIFSLAILIPACASSSPAFLTMYSSYKLNKQDDNIQPWCTPFPIWNQSVVPCPVLTVASWPAYKFLKRQVRWSGIPICVCTKYKIVCFRIFHCLLWSTQSKSLAFCAHSVWLSNPVSFHCETFSSCLHWRMLCFSVRTQLMWRCLIFHKISIVLSAWH